MATARTFTAANFVLTLDGVTCGFVGVFDGGGISADVVESAVDSSLFAKKHIGQPKYEDIVVQVGLSMAQQVYDWIAASLAGNFVRKDGSVTTADVDFNAKAQTQFSRALVTEVGFPALDGASKSAAHLTLTFSPELTKLAKGSGKVPTTAGGKQKAFASSNFRLELDGLDCKQVRRIDGFAVQVRVATDDIGDARNVQKEPTAVEVPNLHVTIADGGSTAASWQKFFDDFVLNGNNDESKEKSGAIVYLSPDLKTELGRVVLHNVGICALRHPSRIANSEQVSTLVAELYCERVELQVGKQAPAPQPQPVKPVERPIEPIATPTRPLGIRR